MNAGLLDDVYSTTTGITSDEELDSEYDTDISASKLVAARRRYSVSDDTFSSTSSVYSIKRPSTPQGGRMNGSYAQQQRIGNESNISNKSNRSQRPSSAPKNLSRQTLSTSSTSVRGNSRAPTPEEEKFTVNTVKNRELEDLKLVLVEEQNNSSRLAKSNETLRAEILALKSTVKNLQLDYETMKTANESLLSEAESMKQKYDRIQRNYRNIQQLYKEEKQKRVAIEENRAELQTQVSKMRVSLHQHKNKLDQDHKEKTVNYDNIKEQHDQTRQDINILLEYISAMEQHSMQQQKQFEEISTVLVDQNKGEESTYLSGRNSSSVQDQNPELSERVKGILESYHPEKQKKNAKKVKGNPLVRNFNDLRHLAGPQANSSTYQWEASLRHSRKPQGNASNTVNTSNQSSHLKTTLQQENSEMQNQTQAQVLEEEQFESPKKPEKKELQTSPKSITIPRVTPEKKVVTNNKELGSSQLLKIIEQSQNLITHLKSNESFISNNNMLNDKSEYSNIEPMLEKVDIGGSIDNLFAFSPKKEDYKSVSHDDDSYASLSYVQEQPMANDEKQTSELLSKLSQKELQHLLTELIHQRDEITNSTTLSEEQIKVKEDSIFKSSEADEDNEPIALLTRDLHFPNPESEKIMKSSPYKNEREMIVKQRLHERLAYERKKLGVGLDL